MARLVKLIAYTLLIPEAVQAQPRITGILNNASYLVPPLPGSSIAPGSLFAVFGERIGPADLIHAGFPLPTDLSGSSLRVSASGNNVSAFLVYTSAKQLAAVLPSSTPIGPALARVTYNGQESEPFPFTVVRNSPGLFTLNGGGTGSAVLTTPDLKVITYANAALEGDVLSAWATGVTALQGRADNTAAEFFDPQLAVEVIAGGKQANVRYRGRAPGLAGVDQIVFDVPSGVAGCRVSLVVRVGGVLSNFSTLAVGGASRICSDAHGLTQAEVAKGLEGGLRAGIVNLNRSRVKTVPPQGTSETQRDFTVSSFNKIDADAFLRSANWAPVSFGNCVVTAGVPAVDDLFDRTTLNAGPQLTVTGPGGTRPIPRDARTGLYGATFGSAPVTPGGPPPSTLFFHPGTFVVAGPGGPDVGGFTARVTIPQSIVTNLASIETVSRGAPLTVTWTGGAGNEYVLIGGFSQRLSPSVSATFTCSERASAGRFQVPSEVLLALPPSETFMGVALGNLVVESLPFTDIARFSAPGIDVGFINYTFSEGKGVAYQ